MADALAFDSSKLKRILDELPVSFVILDDNGYRPTERVITPYCGADGLDRDNMTFNFYLSQLRIRIEMCFGLLRTKWGILQEKQKCSLETITAVIECCIKLHNYVILKDDEYNGLSDSQIQDRINSEEREPPLISRGATEEEGFDPAAATRGASQTRDALRDFIKERRYTIPGHNVARNQGRR
jgi:DDE superfamily endonuclease